LDGYKNEISFIKGKKLKADELIISKWESYSSSEYAPLKSYNPGTPLLDTNWGQGTPYNNSCPPDPDTTALCLVGCNGVALGQVLNYWECKVFPDNTSSYFCWSLGLTLTVNYYIRNYDWDDIGSVVSAKADFLYDCAVAVKSVPFTASNTYSSIEAVKTAFQTYYGFNPT